MSRINVKLVAVLTGLFLFVGVLVGALWYFNFKKDTDRLVAKGDQLVAEGDYRNAYDRYGRAVSKKPGRLDYLEKLEASILKIVPKSRDEANELYKQRIGILQQRVKYHGSKPDVHRALLAEALYAARMSNTEDWWRQVREAAVTMREQLLDGDPARLEANMYAAMATFRRAVAETEETLEEAQADIAAFLEANPTSDMGWATMLAARLTRMQKAWTEGQQGRAEELAVLADDTFSAAILAVPDGPEVARMAVLHLALKRDRMRGDVRASQSDDDELSRAVDQLVARISQSDDPVLIADTADVLKTISWPKYVDQAIGLLQECVDREPHRLIHMAMLGELQSKRDLHDDAEVTLRRLIDASGMTVSYESKVHDQLQKQAAALLVDVAQRRWELTDDAGKAAALAKVGEAVDELRTLVIDPESDDHYLRAEGKYLFSKGDFRAAATRFDQLCRSESGASDDVLEYAARSLERINELGLAYDRMRSLLARYPDDERLLYDSARLAFNLKRYDEAVEICEDLLEVNPEHNQGRQLLGMARIVLASGDAGESIDPTIQAMNDAIMFMNSGDINSARETLKNVLELEPDNPQLLYTIVRVELAAGDDDQAKVYLGRLLEIQPDNQQLRRLLVTIGAEDPVKAVSSYVDLLGLNEADHAVAMVINFATFVTGQQRFAQQLENTGDADGAARARELADRAAAEITNWLTKATALAPDSPQLQEYRFRRAMVDKDWAVAERVVEQVRTSNADLAGGALFAGELALARDNPEAAITRLSEASRAIPHSSMVWRVLGNAHERLGNFGQAREAYEEAYQNNPNDIETVRYYVTLLTRVGDDTRALRVMRTAHRVIPNDVGLREVWLRLETRAGDPEIVLSERRRIYAATPGDRVNAEQLASFLATMQPTRDTIADNEGKPVFTEISWMQLSTGAQQQAILTEKERWYFECDRILDELEASGASGALDTAVLRALLLKERGDIAGGQQAIADLVERTPEGERTVEMMIALGNYQRETGQLEEAIATLENARTLQDPVQREAEVALGDLFFREQQYAEAVEAYTRATEVNPDSAVQLNVIECHIKLGLDEQMAGIQDRMFGRVDEAEAHYAASLDHFKTATQKLETRRQSGEDGYYEAMLLASIADGEGDLFYSQRKTDEADRYYAERDSALRKAEELSPTNPQPLIQRAQHLLRAFNREVDRAGPEEAARVRRQSSKLDDALRALKRADEVQAGNLQTSFTRVAVHQARQDVTGAIGELTRLISRFPDNLAARRRLVQLHHAERNVDAAYQTLQAGIRRNPSLTMWHEMKGDLFLDEIRMRRRERAVFPRTEVTRLANMAESAYRELATLKVSAPAIGKLVGSILSREPSNQRERLEMYREAANTLRTHETLLTSNPTLKSIYAVVLRGLDDHESAVTMLENAFHQFVEQERSGAQEPGTIREWYKSVVQVFADKPASEIEGFLMELREGDLTTGDYHWLAGVWAGDAEGLSRALEMEQLAIDSTAGEEMNAEKAALYFSLAGYLLSDGQNEEATRPLSKVLEFDPFNKSALNNYAFLLATLLDQPQEALQYALRARSQMRDADPDELKSSILDTIGWIYFQLGQLVDAETSLRQSRIYRVTASNTLHMAHVMYRSGDFTQAEEFLIRATELNPDDTTREEIDKLAADIRQSRR